MGPQLDSCGRFGPVRTAVRLGSLASMGPQLDSCGRLTIAGGLAKNIRLQWGRNLIVAEGQMQVREIERVVNASMGPQLDSCGRRMTNMGGK